MEISFYQLLSVFLHEGSKNEAFSIEEFVESKKVSGSLKCLGWSSTLHDTSTVEIEDDRHFITRSGTGSAFDSSFLCLFKKLILPENVQVLGRSCRFQF